MFGQVFQPLSGLAAEVAQLSPPLAHWRKFLYCERLDGHVWGEVDHFKGGCLGCLAGCAHLYKMLRCMGIN